MLCVYLYIYIHIYIDIWRKSTSPFYRASTFAYIIEYISIMMYIPRYQGSCGQQGPTWVLATPGGPHVGPMNLAIMVVCPVLWFVMFNHVTINPYPSGSGHGRSWWRHQIETFSALLVLCAGNSPVTGEFHVQRPVTRGFDVLFDLHMNKQLSKQSWDWWFETPSCSLWRHCNA